MANKFSQKLLTFSFSLAQGSFGGKTGAGNTASISTTQPQGANSGLRASCQIEISGGSTSARMTAAIFGLPLSLMNQLTTLPGILNAVANNTITVQAGDADGMSTVFEGTIFKAWIDGQSQPHVAFRVLATPDILQRMQPAKSTSVAGSADVATLMSQLASTMGLAFENNGVSVKLSNPYLSGPPRIQAAMLAEHAGIQHLVDKGKLSIWNPGQGRNGAAAMISPATGMIGYPDFDSASVVVRTVFDPSINCGGTMQVQSQITAACGTWNVYKAEHTLESFMPKGKWETKLWGVNRQSPQVGG